MRRTAAKFVPRLLNSDQKEHRIAVRIELKEQAENDPNFISTIITVDESCVFGHDAETNQQSFQWKTPNSRRPKKTQQIRSNVKSVLIFFYIESIMHKEFVLPGQTVKRKLYWDVLRRLRENI